MEAHIIKQSDTLTVRKDLITLKTTKKHWPRRLESIGSEAGSGPSNSLYFKEGDAPWVLKRDDLSLAKDVIIGVSVPSSYRSSLQPYFTMDEHLSELNLHDHLNLLRVCIMSKT